MINAPIIELFQGLPNYHLTMMFLFVLSFFCPTLTQSMKYNSKQQNIFIQVQVKDEFSPLSNGQQTLQQKDVDFRFQR